MICDSVYLVVPQKSKIFGSRKSLISVLLMLGISPIDEWFSKIEDFRNTKNATAFLFVFEHYSSHQSQIGGIPLFKIGIFSALGIITFYIILGIIFSLFGAVIGPYIQVFQYIIAILFVVFGIMLVRKFTFTTKLFDNFKRKVHSQAMNQSGYK